MCGRQLRRLLVVTAAAVAAWLGCGTKAPPATQPVAGASGPKLIAAESASWSREEACIRLADARLGVSAAVRLVRLAGVASLCVPEELTDAHVGRLRLAALGAERWVLGLAERNDDRRLRAPVLIRATGEVVQPLDGIEEELAVLHVSRDADVFPHVVTLPQRVLLVTDGELIVAIALETCEHVRFDLREQRGFGYVALVLTAAGETEVARYRWDPYELAFMGPACDKLPDPPDGKFQINLEASQRLEPVGGEIPAPTPDEEIPVPAAPEDEWA